MHLRDAASGCAGVDRWRTKLEAAVRDKEAVSTAALLDLLGAAKTTGNVHRVAKTMHALNFVPIKSRRLMPGGFRGAVIGGGRKLHRL